MKFLFSSILLIWSISACSPYQSKGRKFLEQNAYEYAHVSANFVECRESKGAEGYSLVHSEKNANVFASSANPLLIRVVPLVDRPYGCDYGFTSADELNAKMAGAIEFTFHQMSIDHE